MIASEKGAGVLSVKFKVLSVPARSVISAEIESRRSLQGYLKPKT
jgi:hypothetical protein